tara:strand:+ start:177 stop:566 length:390 start_codon:yes stop_codon:yes gene_type:complete
MKFEANIPSYLKTGSGSFPVGDTGASKRKKPTNFYEQAQQGFEMSATTEDTQTLYTPQGMTSKIEPNFFQTMQAKASSKPIKPIRPMMPEELPELEEDIPENLQNQPARPGGDGKIIDENETDEDTFIG